MSDIAAGRLTETQLAANFSEANAALTSAQALVEAQRCYFCHDAPCIRACPTGIDVPSFIADIASGNMRGSALTILDANIFGGACARVCPTEELCERACVRSAQEGLPIKIGLLQRHATDWLARRGIVPFERGPASGRRVAVVGAGPAGLACAHRLARFGHEVTVYEARPRPGGLNEYGIAAYKMVDDFAQREVQSLLAVGGISIEHGRVLGRDLALETLRNQFDAVFLAIGQRGAQQLGLANEDISGIRSAVDFIAELRQSSKKNVAVGRRVLVIGGGNTAIDAAVQARRLGAEEVTVIYRRGLENMSATVDEREWAQVNDVRIREWAAPVRIAVESGSVVAVTFARTRIGPAGRLINTDEEFQVGADMLLVAIGQRCLLGPVEGALNMVGGRITIDGNRATSVPGVYAGGDCVPGPDLTVNAVEDGKRAAEAIHRWLGV